MESFKDVAEEVAQYVGESGTCADDPQIKTAVNEARRLLYKLGDWKWTTGDLAIQSYNGTITLPAEFDHITKSWYPLRKLLMENEWFKVITDGMDGKCANLCRPIKMNQTVVTFRDFGMYYPDCHARIEAMFESDREDENTEIVLHGYSRMDLRVRLPRKVKEKGFVGITETPVIDQFVTSLYQVSKPLTDGRVRIYAYHPDTDDRLLVAFYEAGDVNPCFYRYRVSYTKDKVNQYLVTAKRKYRPIVNDTDPVDISTDALIHALHGLAARKARSTDFDRHMQLATSILQKEIGEEEAHDQSFVKMTPSFHENTSLIE